jgi:hypothetical protein
MESLGQKHPLDGDLAGLISMPLNGQKNRLVVSQPFLYLAYKTNSRALCALPATAAARTTLWFILSFINS